MEHERIVEVIPARYFPPVIRKVGIYCRVSTRYQEQLHSMAAQVSFFIQMAQSRYNWHLTDSYLDFRSGSTQSGREEFQRMMNDCRNKKIDLILTKNVSRFGRNTEEALITLRELRSLGVDIIFQDDNIDTQEMDSELIFTVMAMYAEQQNESRRDNQLWGMNKRLEDGSSLLYKRPCFGYFRDPNGELQINPCNAKAVQNIFKWYLDGDSIIRIVRKLDADGTFTPTGHLHWNKRSVEKILRNEKYIGNVLVMKTVTIVHKRVKNRGEVTSYLLEGSHPPIITREIYDAVQEEIVRRSNVDVDETTGTRTRKKTKYSSKRAN